MITSQEQNTGTGHHTALRTYAAADDGSGQDVNSLIENQDQTAYMDYREDFVADSASVPGGQTDYSPTGAPVFAIVSGVGGWVSALLAADNAAMIAGYSSNDNLWLPSDRYLKKMSRVMFLDALVTAQYALMGVSGIIESGVNPATLAGWVGAAFYLDASMVLHVKIEDGNSVSIDETLSITVDTDVSWWYLVEHDEFGAWNFYFGPGNGLDGSLVYSTLTPDFDANQLFQPLDVVGKSEGVTTPAIYVDCQIERMRRGPLASQL